MPILTERAGRVAIVKIENAPVNAIGQAERAGLLAAVSTLDADDGFDAVVLMGQGSNFAAGADAREFDGPALEPHLPQVVAAIEGARKPWIAAIRGAALGGGLELALGCRWRIAHSTAQLGLPETGLGVVPGAGGTQRLPRLIGLAAALDLVPEGKTVNGRKSLELGLVDQLADDPLAAALALDLMALASRPSVSAMPAPAADEAAIAETRTRVGKRKAGEIAPQVAIDLLVRATADPFDKAMAAEREAFLTLRQSDQAKALRHIFFAERATRKPKELKPIQGRPIDHVLVVGGGTMGASIAYGLHMAGITSGIIEADEAAIERARTNVDKLFDDAEKRGLMNADTAATGRAAVSIRAGYADLPPVGLVIEAAFEDMTVKKQIFSALEAALPADAILATNTSYLDVNEIAASVTDPTRVIGLHFFAPAHIMKLMEIVAADKTSDTALSTGFDLAARLKKIAVISGVCDGFIGNRILARYRRAADDLLVAGALPHEIDAAMVDFGYAMGPYMTQDMSGLDIAWANRKRQAATRDPAARYVTIADTLCEAGRFGRKTGRGWYDYASGKPMPDLAVAEIVETESRRLGITRQTLPPREISDRLVAAMIDEAAAILSEGIARSAADIDIVLVNGYGFPRWRGGLLHCANSIGTPELVRRISNWRAQDPDGWALHPHLLALAETGAPFA